MADEATGGVICDSAALIDSGPGVRFHVRWQGQDLPAFAVRHAGVVQAYLNRCRHRGVELDWQPGEFFDRDGHALVCATHGARYSPVTGLCLEGPCRGQGLVKLAVIEKNNRVWLNDDASELSLPKTDVLEKR